jgi:hypothetical protein
VLSREKTGENTEGFLFKVWADYELLAEEGLRRAAWRTGQVRQVNARGNAPLVPSADTAALDDASPLNDAAKNAVLAVARGLLREKPGALRGRIALCDFPSLTIAHGEWSLSAKFFVNIMPAS